MSNSVSSTQNTLEPADFVLQFLRTIGKPREAEYYLSLFRQNRPERFAIISVSDSVMRGAEEALVLDLRFLADLGLFPAVVFGLKNPKQAQDHAHQVARQVSKARSFQFSRLEDAKALLENETIPLVAMDSKNAPTVDARFDRLTGLAATLQTQKLVFLQQRARLEPLEGPNPSLVALKRDFAELVVRLDDKQSALLRQVKRMLEATPHPMTVAVTSPLDLLRELFTVRGAGTLIRCGSDIKRYNGYEGVQQGRLRALLETAFSRKLREDFFEHPIKTTYVADEYRGAALIEDTPLGPYLGKFVVDRKARGEGVGRDLWQTLANDCTSFFWRSRPGNPISSWYQKECDGMHKDDAWHIYWRRMPKDRIPAIIEHARTTTPTWI